MNAPTTIRKKDSDTQAALAISPTSVISQAKVLKNYHIRTNTLTHRGKQKATKKTPQQATT